MIPNKQKSDKQLKYDRAVVQPIVDALLNNETIPWVNPVAGYRGLWPQNGLTGHEFSGGNVFVCLFHMMTHKLECPLFATYQQLKNAEIYIEQEYIRKYVVLTVPRFGPKKVYVDEETGEERSFTPLVGFTYINYYNLQHTRDDWESRIPEGIKLPQGDATFAINDILSMPNPPKTIWDSSLDLWYLTTAAGAYDKQADKVLLHDRSSYKSDPAAASVLAHEYAHATGHEKRLFRETLYRETFSFEGHTKEIEEVIAEATAALISAEYGLDPMTFNNSVAYMQHWGYAIKENPDILWSALAEAWKAKNYILQAAKKEVHYEQVA